MLLTIACASFLLAASLPAQTSSAPASATATLVTELSPLNVVPPVEDQNARGTAEIRITVTEGSADAMGTAGVVNFKILLENLPASGVVAVGVYRGAFGTNGTLVFDSGFVPDPNGTDTITSQLELTTSEELSALLQLLENPQNHYVLITTAANTSGLLRGQLELSESTVTQLISRKIDLMQLQLNAIERMVRAVAIAAGIPPTSLPPANSASQ
jgi:hypothetical protein